MKRNFIKLAKGFNEEGEPKFQTFVTPGFIPFRLIYEASDVMSELENKSEKENMDTMLDMVTKIYNNQFTKDELIDGLHSAEAVEEIKQQIEFISSGAMDDHRKEELGKILKK